MIEFDYPPYKFKDVAELHEFFFQRKEQLTCGMKVKVSNDEYVWSGLTSPIFYEKEKWERIVQKKEVHLLGAEVEDVDGAICNIITRPFISNGFVHVGVLYPDGKMTTRALGEITICEIDEVLR